jgi:hypothetical protein
MGNLIEDVVLGIFRPGTNTSTFKTLNYTLYALFASIAFTLWAGFASFHVTILAVLSVGLYFSVNWFYNELQMDKAANAGADESEEPETAPVPEAAAQPEAPANVEPVKATRRKSAKAE